MRFSSVNVEIYTFFRSISWNSNLQNIFREYTSWLEPWYMMLCGITRTEEFNLQNEKGQFASRSTSEEKKSYFKISSTLSWLKLNVVELKPIVPSFLTEPPKLTQQVRNTHCFCFEFHWTKPGYVCK